MNNSYSCPADCATPLLLPALPADPYCELAPKYSQVAQLVVAPCQSEDPFIDDTGSAALHTTLIDNTNADNTAPRLLIGQGGVDEHEPVIYDGAFRTQKVSRRNYTMNFGVTIEDPLQYEFLRALQCGLKFRFWYIDLGNWLFGPLEALGIGGGLIPSLVNVQMPKGAGRDDLGSANIIITWEDNTDPARWVSPLPDSVSSCIPAA